MSVCFSYRKQTVIELNKKATCVKIKNLNNMPWT